MSSTRSAGRTSRRASPADVSAAALSRRIWTARYRSADEPDVAASWARIARAAAGVEADPAAWVPAFEAILSDFRFLPGGRIQAGAGRAGAVLFNCFVLPGPDGGVESSLAALARTLVTLRAGGGVGCDFSQVPPRGTPSADGPLSPGPAAFLELWDSACRTYLAESPRQGAMMGSLACEHPDVADFARAKARPGALSRFNLSVGVSDAFMAAVREDRPWALRFPRDGAPVRTLPARELWELILRSAYETGEPGVLFVDRINAVNNLAWRERIATTNPCGEIPLPDYGACDLGALNLTRFVLKPFQPGARMDLEGLAKTARVAVRLLDDVIDLSAYPLPEQAAAVKGSRRVGLGITDLADALVMLGHTYGEPGSLAAAAEIMRTVRDAAYRASAALAAEKGAFPQFEAERYLARPFVRSLPEDIRQAIGARGIRNSHLLAIAPTGSISLLAGGISTGVEPIFAGVQDRRVRSADGKAETLRIVDPALALWRRRHEGGPPSFVTAQTLPIAAHIAMQAALQPYVDNAISKTVNAPADLPFKAFRTIYDQAYAQGLKGCTAFRPAAAAVLRSGEAVEGGQTDPNKGRTR